MTSKTFLNLKRVLNELNDKCVIEESNPENLKIEIRDNEEIRQNGVYKFVKEKNKFIEQTKMSNFKPDYEPEEFIQALKMFNYMVEVTVA